MNNKVNRDGVQLAQTEPRCVPSVHGPVRGRCVRFHAEIKDRHQAIDFSTERGCNYLCAGFLMPAIGSRFRNAK